MSTQNLWFSCPALAGAILIAALPVFPQSEREGKDPGVGVGRLVVVGDSLSAGFQNFSLFDSSSAPLAPPGGQKHGYAALVAAQAGVSLTIPLISYPGIPPALALDASGQIIRAAGIGARENPASQAYVCRGSEEKAVPAIPVVHSLARTRVTASCPV
jgi:hypothetical protein